MSAADSRTLWIILAVALLLRVGTAVGLHRWLEGRQQTFLIEGDAGGYWMLGERIADGEEYALYRPPRHALRMPGFPALLALPIAIFQSPLLPARLMLAGVGTLGCGLVYILGRMLFDTPVATTAAALTAVAPVMVGFSPVILSETSFAVSLVASLIGMAWWMRCDGRSVGWIVNPSEVGSPASDGRIDNPSYGKATVIGLVIGGLVALACYFRPSWILAGPLFGAGAIITSAHKGRAAVMAVCVMIGLIGALLPWGLRNQQVTGHFTLTTLWMGPSLYDGLNPQATGASDMTFYDRDNLMGQGSSEYEVDRHYRTRAWEFVRENPGRTLQLAVIKLWRFLSPIPNAEQFGGVGPALLIGPFFVALLLLALRGWWVTRHDVWAWGLTLGPLIYFAAIHMLFVGSLRYRLPAEYPLMVLAAAGWRSWRHHQQNAGRTTRSAG
jgi:hypothetical protein